MAASFGIFILAELPGAAGAQVRAVQQQFDPKLARLTPPHVTLAGSSGVGSIPTDTPLDRIREALEPITSTTAPMDLPFLPPHRFMQTEIISLPLDPHGPLRALHERIARSGLPFRQARFQFSPHCTLSFYPTLTAKSERELLAVRDIEPARIERLQIYLTRDPQPSRKLLELELTGSVVAERGP